MHRCRTPGQECGVQEMPSPGATTGIPVGTGNNPTVLCRRCPTALPLPASFASVGCTVGDSEGASWSGE